MADATTGSTFCIDCGYVLEENTMVSDMSFVQTSSGAAAAAGTFVNIGASEHLPRERFDIH
jgi:transcription factor IIIB subunit 2